MTTLKFILQLCIFLLKTLNLNFFSSFYEFGKHSILIIYFLLKKKNCQFTVEIGMNLF